MHHKYYNNNVIIEYNMIICSSSNIDIIQGNIGYNDPEGITDWRITNTASGSSGTLNILNSLSQTGRVTILDNGNLGIANTNPGSLLDVGGDINITGIYKRNNRDIISDTSNYALSTSNILVPRILTEVGFGSNYTNRLNTALNTRIDNTSNYVLATSNLLANRVSSQWTSVSSGIHYTPMSITSSPLATTGTTSNYAYQIFTYNPTVIEQKTGVGGWRLVRFLPPTSTTWHQGNDNLAGTLTYGTAYNYTNAWSIPFGTFDEFVFGTLNLQYWMYMTKDAAIGANYSNAIRNIIKSSFSSTAYSAIQYNRAENPEDPWMSIRDHGTGGEAAQLVYGENSHAAGSLVPVDGGMGVWVRNSLDDQNTSYNVNFPENTLCDILMVGGGGAGGGQNAGGGGAGGLVLVQNITLAGNFIIKVGNGGSGRTGDTSGLPGINSTLTKSDNSIIITANGGGGGGNTHVDGGNGGSGGGGGFVRVNGTQTQKSQSQIGIVSPTILNQYGENGGHGGSGVGNSYPGGGGGGAGGVGATSPGDETGQNGGLGIDRVGTYIFKDNFNSSIGDNGWFAGGGGSAGGYQNTNYAYGNGGSTLFGGGGNGDGVGRGINGINGTGGGGGGARLGAGGGNGGSGIVIIRYISSTNVGIGTTSPATELHVYDDTTNNTTLTVQNNYIDPVVIYPNTVGYTATETLESSKFYRTLTFNYFANYPENPPNTALLAWYRFDGDGLDYNPYATKYNLIANVGTPTYSSGTSADSFFQGRRYINTGTGSLRNTSLSLNSRAFSIALWMRKKNSSVALFIAQSASIGVNTSLHIGQRENNVYTIDFYGNGLNSASSYPEDINTWAHIVYVVLSNYNRRIYRNGILITSDSNTTAFSGSGDLRIGASYSDNASQNIDISDLRIYNNGLSATEVATLYNSYTSLVITDNYAINFNKSSTVLVNSVSKTVNGLYNISMGHINSSMLPAAGQADTPLASTATTSVAIKYEYSNTSTSLPNLITVAGATSSIIGTTERAISFTYTSDSSGLTGQTQYSFTPTEDLWCDILVVGGGGGGGKFGGGGGGGGVLFSTNLKINAGSTVVVKVGDGGAGNTVTDGGINGINGYNSSIIINSIEYIALGGGGGGSRANYPNYIGSNGATGGSGGGGGNTAVGSVSSLGGVSNKNNYANFQSFGNDGGKGRPNSSGLQPTYSSGGGGGAGSIGSDFSNTTGGGNGGRGKDFISYFGTNVGHMGWFAGGGGGNSYYDAGNRGYGNGGNGLYGGGGNGGFDGTLEYSADNGLINTGGGGGGSQYDGTTTGSANGGNGGSGFVIIRYRRNRMQSAALELIRSTNALPNELTVTGSIGAVIGTTDRYISFPYSGTGTTKDYTFTTTESLNCDILVIGGGGSGGGNGGGGGGAGGYVYLTNIRLSQRTTYNVSVGSGGLGTYDNNTSGNNSSITGGITYVALGGGRGGSRMFQQSRNLPQTGGSGGGGGGDISTWGIGQASTQSSTYGYGIGFAGANAFESGANSAGGGGGGAGSAGTTGTSQLGGNGGNGVSNNITGSSVIYCAGGGGGVTVNGSAGSNGSSGTGSFGSGSKGGNAGVGASNGTNGIVIIRYRKANTNYKIGNYGGDFKIIYSTYSSTSTISQDTDYMRITRDGASIYNPTGSPQWSTTSDRRIKENIEKASYTKCYDNINKLELYRFNYIKDFNNINKDLRQLGYIAQEVNDIFPKAVTTQHFNNQNLSVPDLLTIDITQINYSLYGAVKKLIEMYNDIGKKINVLEKLLNIDTSASDSIIADEISTSNIIITEASTSNLTTDTSNLIITDTSNVIINDTSNVIITYTSNLITDTSNVIITEVSTSNITTDTSNLIITEVSTSNVITDTSNLITDTSNIIITEVATSNVIITEAFTSNLITDTSNVIITEASTSNLITDTSNVIITEASTSNLTQDAS